VLLTRSGSPLVDAVTAKLVGCMQLARRSHNAEETSHLHFFLFRLNISWCSEPSRNIFAPHFGQAVFWQGVPDWCDALAPHFGQMQDPPEPILCPPLTGIISHPLFS